MALLSLAERIAHAEQEYHALSTGTKARAVVDANGERVEFTRATRGDLRQYIDDLKRQLNGCDDLGPATVVF